MDYNYFWFEQINQDRQPDRGMAEFFRARRLRYQISLLIEGRWRLILVVDDGRDQLRRAFDRADLDKLEDSVRVQARAALAAQGARAVRVIRERIRADGYSLEENFLHEEAPAVKPAERQVSAYAGPVPPCTRFDDLLQRPALRAIGLIMRPLLDRLGMTPIELVTLKAATSPVKRAEAGINAAIAMAARLQAEAENQPVRARVARIEALAEECRRRTRAAALAGGPPKLGPIGLDRMAAAIAERFPPAERRFWGLRGIAEFIAGPTDYPAKLDRLLDLNQPELGAASLDLFDEAAAGLVDHSSVVRLLLGEQPDLRVALFRLAELAAGAPPPNSAAPDAAAQLALLIDAGRLPKTRDALLDRLGRSLAGRRNLAGSSLRAEQAAVAELLDRLLPALPDERRAEAAAALTRRQARALQAILDEMER
jgi:hypothetical protein